MYIDLEGLSRKKKNKKEEKNPHENKYTKTSLSKHREQIMKEKEKKRGAQPQKRAPAGCVP